ncbi:unnamed protein product [Heterobilharzia americana]|nr:unnamed protein product [Heterobilharzia americana]
MDCEQDLNFPFQISSQFPMTLESQTFRTTHVVCEFGKMGIRGLLSYVQSNCENFIPYELHNQFLVVDGENFAAYCYRQAALQCQYAGEYLAYNNYVRLFLRRFRDCRVEPIFIFDGCHPKKGSKLNTLLRRTNDSLKKLSSFLFSGSITYDSDNPQLNIDIIPRLCRYVLVEILREFSIRYTACEREADLCVAQLAIYLNCPATSGDSDFFIYRSLVSDRVYRFIPLSSLTSDLLNNSGPFYKLQYPMLPIFAILVGNDVVSNIRLPSTINTLIQSYGDKIVSYYQRRIHAIFNWLSSFQGDVEQPLTAILKLYNQNEMNDIIETMHLGMLEYIYYNSVEALAHSLGLTGGQHVSSNTPSAGTLNRSCEEITEDSYQCKLEAGVNFLKAMLISPLAFNPTQNNDEESIFYRWPKELVRRFKHLELVPSLLDSLYVHHGSVNRITVEDLTVPYAVGRCAYSLRVAQYGLILGLETHLGARKKLCGVENDYVVEYSRKSSTEISKNLIQVKPIFPSTSKVVESSFLSFFSRYFNINLDKCFRPLEMQGLAGLLVLWFTFSSHARNKANRLRESPVGLAFSCCAIAVKSNCNSFKTNHGNLDNVCSHLNNCADIAKSMYCRNNKPSFCISYVHQLNELQTMVVGMTHLVALVDVLCPFYASNIDNTDPSSLKNPFISFDPFWMLFASGRLLYWISRILDNMVPNERFHKVIGEWLPRLLVCGGSYDRQLRFCQHEFNRLFTLIDNLNK